MESILSGITLDGISLGGILLVCGGVFVGSLIDAIAGGGGLVTVPAYLFAFAGCPTYYVLGTNKLSSCTGTLFSTARFIKNGLVNWKLCTPAMVLAVLGSILGTWLQHHTPDIILKYFLVLVLPIVAFFSLRGHEWPDTPSPLSFQKQALIVWCASLVIGVYDGYYGPGTGTFLMLVFIRMAKIDTRHAAGMTKVINLSSNVGGLASALVSGYVFLHIGLLASVFSILGHYLGAGLAIQNGSKIVRPAILLVLTMLLAKVGYELILTHLGG